MASLNRMLAQKDQQSGNLESQLATDRLLLKSELEHEIQINMLNATVRLQPPTILPSCAHLLIACANSTHCSEFSLKYSHRFPSSHLL